MSRSNLIEFIGFMEIVGFSAEGGRPPGMDRDVYGVRNSSSF